MNDSEKRTLELNVLKSNAIRQAMVEVVGEHRLEIIKRAQAKLVAQGIEVSDSELDSHGT